jgi:hypothetical protein
VNIPGFPDGKTTIRVLTIKKKRKVTIRVRKARMLCVSRMVGKTRIAGHFFIPSGQLANHPGFFGTKCEVNRLAPPVTECLVAANLPGGLYERMATTGGSVEMGGTTVIPIASKQTTMAHNSTKAEINAASFLGKSFVGLSYLWETLAYHFKVLFQSQKTMQRHV